MKHNIKCWCYRCAAAGTGIITYLTAVNSHGWHIGHPFF